MRTKDKDSPTKKKILDGAQELMIQKGYAGTSVDDVCARARVTKGNFFYHFKTKEALGGALLDRFGKGMRDGFCCTMDKAGADPLERVYAVIDSLVEAAKSPDLCGCLIGTFSQEAEAIGPKLRAQCCDSFKGGRELFRGYFEAAKKKYAPKAAFDPAELADFFIAMIQGSFVLMKAKQDRKLVAANLRLMRAYLKSLYGR